MKYIAYEKTMMEFQQFLQQRKLKICFPDLSEVSACANVVLLCIMELGISKC